MVLIVIGTKSSKLAQLADLIQLALVANSTHFYTFIGAHSHKVQYGGNIGATIVHINSRNMAHKSNRSYRHG